jgi:hypothetical protein
MQAHPDIVRFADACLIASPFDLTVHDVYRREDEQERAFEIGASHLHYPDSIHNQCDWDPHTGKPLNVRAIDLAPVNPRWEDMPMWFSLCGYFRRVAEEEEILITSGLDWNSNWKFKDDQSFWDGPHWELR